MTDTRTANSATARGADTLAANGASGRVRIKLCGLMREEDIEAVNEVRPDFAGFILAEGRRRSLSPERVAALRVRLAPGILAVGVFLDQAPDFICRAADLAGLDLIQLHGCESEETIREVQRMSGRPVIKAFRIDGPADIARAAASGADCVLLDSGAGGTGSAFDQALAATLTRPYFLAGGLDAGNVAQSVRRLRPFAVDVSSGIETAGAKDRTKMKAFAQAARLADTK